MRTLWIDFYTRLGLRPVTVEGLRRYLSYDAETGIFTKIDSPIACQIGNPTGTVQGGGYVGIRAGGKLFKAHHLAWLFTYGVWPKYSIDHKNRDPADNRICNLRIARHSQNMANKGPSKNNKLGVKGVVAKKNRFQAFASVNGKRTYLGSFETIEAASAAYAEAHRNSFGEFASTV